MPDQLAAQRGAEHELVVAAEPGDARAGPALDDGERRAGPLDLARGGGQQLTGRGGLQTEHGGDLFGGQVMAYGEFQRLALFRGGAAASGQASRASSRRRSSRTSSATGGAAGGPVRRRAGLWRPAAWVA
ncbi:hypothetical protein SGLAM104S_10078 [Streptomyces glaucescens]